MIVAHRRRDVDYWEGHKVCAEAETKEWADYYRSLGQIVEVFTSTTEFRADCNKLLDMWRAKRTRQRGDEVTF